jgi:hypothetical protein
LAGTSIYPIKNIGRMISNARYDWYENGFFLTEAEKGVGTSQYCNEVIDNKITFKISIKSW